jgi:hypothetical protein
LIGTAAFASIRADHPLLFWNAFTLIRWFRKSYPTTRGAISFQSRPRQTSSSRSQRPTI